ncbi:MAG: 16S rRNA processing protein RimM [Bacteroidales bacterium]|nr:16S rRNA processing protein RimM [Bacteroidales bacterium]
MDLNDFFLLGYITKTHGLTGGLTLVMDVDDPSEYMEIDGVFVKMKHEIVPHMISQIEHVKKNVFTIQIEDIDSINAAKKFVNKECYLPIELLPKLDGTKFYYHEIIGFKVMDVNQGDAGVIEKVLDLPRQALIQSNKDGIEILIPISDDIIKKVDRENKILEVDTPEGLIDLYLNDE